MGVMHLTEAEIVSSSVVGDNYFLLFDTGVILRVELTTGVFSHYYSEEASGLGSVGSRLMISTPTQELKELAFQDKGDSTYSYKSGKMSDGALCNFKEYDKVRVNIEGQAILSVWIDNKLVLKQHKITEKPIGLPNEFNKGYAIQFEVIGVGALHSIEYSLKGRENG